MHVHLTRGLETTWAPRSRCSPWSSPNSKPKGRHEHPGSASQGKGCQGRRSACRTGQPSDPEHHAAGGHTSVETRPSLSCGDGDTRGPAQTSLQPDGGELTIWHGAHIRRTSSSRRFASHLAPLSTKANGKINHPDAVLILE